MKKWFRVVPFGDLWAVICAPDVARGICALCPTKQIAIEVRDDIWKIAANNADIAVSMLRPDQTTHIPCCVLKVAENGSATALDWFAALLTGTTEPKRIPNASAYCPVFNTNDVKFVKVPYPHTLADLQAALKLEVESV